MACERLHTDGPQDQKHPQRSCGNCFGHLAPSSIRAFGFFKKPADLNTTQLGPESISQNPIFHFFLIIKQMKFSKNIILKFLPAIALLFACTYHVDAQKGEFGLRLMPTFSAFELQTSSGGKVKGEVTLGFGIGALLGFNFSEHIGVQGEVIYSSVSQKYKEQDVERRVNLRYLNIPLLLSLNTGKTKLVNLNIVGGPQIGISAGSNLFTTGGDNSTPKAVLSVKKGDIGLAYGAGLDFGINPSRTFRLGLGYRGVLGLFDISDNSNSIATDAYYILDRTHVNTKAAYIGMSLLF